MTATTQMVTLTEAALLKRMNRKLAPQLEVVRKLRGPNPPARFFHVNAFVNSVEASFDDLEEYARENGFLRHYEGLAD